jgi:hypothetical protein
MRAAVRVTISMVVAWAAFGGILPTARSSCAAPTVSMRPRSVAPGDTVTVVGEGWARTCNDTCSVSCFGIIDSCNSVAQPVQNLRIALVPRWGDSAVIIVEDVDPDRELGFRVQASVPMGLAPGRYRVVARNDAGHRAVGPTVDVSATTSS